MSNLNRLSRMYGVDISKAKSAEEAMEISGLTWAVQEESLITGSGKDVPSHKALVRADKGTLLGVVGQGYGTIQHSAMFACLDALIQSSGGKWNRAFELKGGKRVAASAILPVNLQARVGDIVKIEAFITQAFDSSLSYLISLSALRLICLNGATIPGKESRICIRHMTNAEARIKDALRLLEVAPRCIEAFSGNMKKLTQKMVDKAMVEKFLDSVIGPATTEDPVTHKVETSKRILNQRELVTNLFQHGEGNRGQTAWDLYHGATEWVNHYRNESNVDSRVNSAMFGSGAEIMETAFESALAL